MGYVFFKASNGEWLVVDVNGNTLAFDTEAECVDWIAHNELKITS